MMKGFIRVLALGLLFSTIIGAQPAAAELVDVTTVALTFVPPDITITVGDSVRWSGLAGGFHTVAEASDAASGMWNGGFHSDANPPQQVDIQLALVGRN